jgi:hypothetical protein
MARIIQTCYIPATDTRPERIRAYFLDGNERVLTAPFPRAFDGNAAHRNIAEELLVQVGWPESNAALSAGLAESHEVLDGFIFIVR